MPRALYQWLFSFRYFLMQLLILPLILPLLPLYPALALLGRSTHQSRLLTVSTYIAVFVIHLLAFPFEVWFIFYVSCRAGCLVENLQQESQALPSSASEAFADGVLMPPLVLPACSLCCVDKTFSNSVGSDLSRSLCCQGFCKDIANFDLSQTVNWFPSAWPQLQPLTVGLCFIIDFIIA